MDVYTAFNGVQMTLTWKDEFDYEKGKAFLADMGALLMPSPDRSAVALFVCLESEAQLEALWEFRARLGS